MMNSADHSRRLRRTLPGLGVVLVGLFALTVACDGTPTSPAGDEARVQILLTDYPLEAIESAEVKISRVYLVGGGQGQVDLFHDVDAPKEFDLLELQDGITAELTHEVPVPAGNYGQLRFEIAEAQILLKEGWEFADGSSEKVLTVPSNSVRVNLQGGGALDLAGGETTVVLVDFNVEQSFVFQGPPGSPHGVLFTPVLHELSRSTSDSEEGDDDDDDDDDDDG